MRLLSLFIFTLLCTASFTQNIVISGKVIDGSSKKPIGYAHVGIPEKGIGTTTASDGSFTFKVPEKYANSTLMASFLGYETFKRPIQNISSPITIKIERIATDLMEIVVMDESRIEDIIRRAVNRIPQNYPTHKTTNLGFYRESRTDADKKYLYMAEGVLNIHKEAYTKTKGKEGQTSLVQGRQVRLIPEEEFSEYSSFTSGHLAGHRFDIVKNLEDFINEDYFDAYRYFIEGITYQNNKPVYIIGFEGEENHKNGRMKGSVYIDTTSYAFVRAEFHITEKGLKKWNDYPLYAGGWDGNKYVVNYTQMGDKWYFRDALREGVYRDGGIYSNEILITEINPEKAKPIPYQERLDRGSRFLDLTGEYDENFWRDYNTAPMSESLRNSLQQEKNSRKAEQVFDPEFMAELQSIQDSIDNEKARQDSILMAKRMEEFDNPKGLERWEKRQRRLQERDWRLKGFLGSGTHILNANPGNMSLTYFTKDDQQPIISVSENVKNRQFETVLQWGGDIYFKKHFFLRVGWAGDFWNSIYSSAKQGFGVNFNLAKKHRPFYVRAIVGQNRLDYARKIGQADNEYGSFKANRKKFKADKINMYYGSRTRFLEGTIELAIEVNPNLEFFAQGTYQHAFARQARIYLWERRELFRKKRHVKLNDQIEVLQDGKPFNERIIDENPMFFSVGVIFK